MFCPACGYKNDDKAKFCKKCGEDFTNIHSNSLNTIGKCPYCAEEINPKAVKCKHCGEWLDRNVERQSRKKDHSAAIGIGYLFSILGGIIGLIFAVYLLMVDDKKSNKHGLIMLFLFIFWFMVLGSFIVPIWNFYLLIIGNILIGLIYALYANIKEFKTSWLKIGIIYGILLLAFLSLFYIPFAGVFIMFFLDLLVILTMLIFTKTEK